MKKLFSMVFVALAMILVSCKEPNTPSEPTTETLEMDVYYLEWYGDYYQNGTTNFVLQLMEDINTYSGTFIAIDFCKEGHALTPEGTYTASTTHEAGHFFIGDGNMGSNIGEMEDSWLVGDMEPLEEGTLTVTKQSVGVYKCVLTYKNKEYVAIAQGMANGAFPSEPIDPVTVSFSGTQASGSYYGATSVGTNEYMVSLGLTNNFVAMIDFFTEGNSSPELLPAGTYTFASNGTAGTMMQGFFKSGNLYPSIIYHVTSTQAVDQGFYLKEGTLAVTYSDGTYTINGTVVSACGSQLTIDFTGSIPFTPAQ
ncbi:MAG: hypothetical protein MJZ96_00970 [Paludibacteraceae bacterium]|nr:hypothetical protein [Paludibacteraceae bacterium]